MAKDFAHEYERVIKGVVFEGLAIYNDSKYDLNTEEERKKEIVRILRRNGFNVRVFHGVYGSRYYGTAVSGWLVMIEKKKYEGEMLELLDTLAKQDDW